MNRETLTVRLEHQFKASAERVFDAWLDKDKARHWFFKAPGGEIVVAEMDARVGGGFRFIDRRGIEQVEHVGTYLEIDRPRRLVFSFYLPAFNPEPDIVTIEIQPTPDGCTLILSHAMDAKYAEYLGRTEAGWGKMLAALAVHL